MVLCVCSFTHTQTLSQDYTVLVRDLTTTLLFLVVFLKWHSEELREAGKKNKKGEEEEEGGRRKYVFSSTVDASSSVNALFVAVADIFHCWFSSPVRPAVHCSSYAVCT